MKLPRIIAAIAILMASASAHDVDKTRFTTLGKGNGWEVLRMDASDGGVAIVVWYDKAKHGHWESELGSGFEVERGKGFNPAPAPAPTKPACSCAGTTNVVVQGNRF